MKRAAETAAQIATGNAGVTTVARPHPRPSRAATTSRRSRSTSPASTSARSSSAPSKAAHAYGPEIIKAEASFAEEVREILVATSDGTLVHDIQPLLRMSVRAVAERDGKRQEGSSGGGGRMTMGYFDDQVPRDPRPRGGPAGHRHARRPRGARRRDGGGAGAGRQRHPPARGGRPRPRGRLQPQGHQQLQRPGGQAGRQRALHGGRRRHAAAVARHHQRRRRGQRAAPQRAHRGRHAGRLHARPPLRQALQPHAHGQRPPRELRRLAPCRG